MISYHYETDFALDNENGLSEWILNVIESKGFLLGEINYIFCDDTYLHKLNVEFLNHDTLTDIISFDYTMGKLISGDIFISIERVKENANEFDVTFQQELQRVMVHGVLHYTGLKDKTFKEKELMREEENRALSKLSN